MISRRNQLAHDRAARTARSTHATQAQCATSASAPTMVATRATSTLAVDMARRAPAESITL
jgi:hypothetical protein